MEKYIGPAAFLAAVMLMGCSCDKGNDPDEQAVAFEATGWNGYMVEEMARAYEEYSVDEEMPVTINVEGIKYHKGQYFAASCKILEKMVQEPDTWQDEDVDFISSPGPDSNISNTINADSMSLADFLGVISNVYSYAEEKNIFPNYCTLEENHQDSDGSVYSIKLPINSIYVMMARVFAYFVENNSLPEEISTWDADYLHETANCEVSDPLVISAMEIATEGKTSDYDRAKAIFDYARDEWEWLDYNNTSKGAAGTIEAKGGNCCDLTHAIVAMSRAAGIPARYRHAQCQYSSSVIGHVIAEIYVDGVWYLADASNNENTFGNHEAWSHMATFNGRYNELPF